MLTNSERRICCTIGICLLIAVLSSVALLNFFVYVSLPARRTLDAEFEDIPEVCETIKAELGKKSHCDDWETCGEWCLSASSFCNHVMVRVRRRGTDLIARNIRSRTTKKCYPTDPAELNILNCSEKECMKVSMNGTFLCEEGRCREIGRNYICNTDNYDIETRNCNGLIMCEKLTGIFDCIKNQCRQLMVENLNSPPDMPDIPLDISDCTPTCEDITTTSSNLLVFYNFHLELLDCDELVEEKNETRIWGSERKHGMITCTKVEEIGPGEMKLYDCSHGVVHSNLGPGPYTITQLMDLHKEEFTEAMDDNMTYAALFDNITIYNYTKLQVNLDGCVNTLKDECRGIFDIVGKDGHDGRNAPAVFPCHYSPKMSEVVILNYDKNETFIRGILFTVIPMCLIVLSCTSLVMCSKFVHVEGERMHIKVCHKGAAHPPPHGFRGRAGNHAPFPGPALNYAKKMPVV